MSTPHEQPSADDAHETNDPVYAFLDTNLLLHFTMLDEVDWCQVLEVSAVCLVLAPIVIHEMNEHKDDSSNARRQRRARDVLRKLDALLPEAAGQEGSVRKGVTICELPRHPQLDWAATGLDPAQGDDRLIASMLQFQHDQPSAYVRLVTADGPLRRKARYHSLQAVDPEGRVPALPLTETAAEIENRKLKEEIRGLIHRTPQLQFGFCGQKGPVNRIEAPLPALKADPPTDEQISDEINKAQAKHLAILASVPTNVNAESVEQYVEKFRRYLEELERSRYSQRSQEFGPLCQLLFCLKNKGGAPATDVRISLEFPAHSFVFAQMDKDLYGTVDAPYEPIAAWKRPPRHPLAIDYSLPAIIPTLSHNPPAKRQGVLYDVEQRDMLYIEYQKVLQVYVQQVPLVIAYLPPTQQQGFTIRYQLRADELPEVVSQDLHVIWENP